MSVAHKDPRPGAASPREALVRELERRGIRDPRVLDALRATPREEFVEPELRPQAYEDRPLPLPHGQSISQPYVVALMSEALGLHPGERVLEIGTGSGYQTAILARLTGEVFTVERWPELAERARLVLERLGHANVQQHLGDGWLGWPERAPFAAILVTAAPAELPSSLLEQLAPGGRMCIPLGANPADQELWLIEKRADGSLRKKSLGGVRFVPMPKGTP